MVCFNSLYSGSKKNSSVISNGELNIMIDCGGSYKGLKDSLSQINIMPKDISALFITHSHSDHISALKCLIKDNPGLKIYSSLGTHEELYDMGVMMHKENRIILDPDIKYDLGLFYAEAIRTPHDTKEPYGYNFYVENKTITVATDIGYIYDEFENKVKGRDFILFESNHDVAMLKNSGRPPHLINRILGKSGHLSNEISAQFTLKLANKGLKKVMLAHISKDANTHELAHQTTFNSFMSNGFTPGKDIELYTAPRDEKSDEIIL